MPPLRLAFWRVELTGRGPGHALQDIAAPSSVALLKAQVIAHVAPDVLVLSGIDYDHGLATLGAFRNLIAAQGHDFPYIHALPSNAGLHLTDWPVWANHTGSADDAQGYGPYRGARALALLSRLPIETDAVRDFSTLLWRDLPDSMAPEMPPERLAIQRLSSTGHWDVPLLSGPDQRLHLLIYQASPPVFGPDALFNRTRNHDETAFWLAYLDHRLPLPPPDAPVILLGGSNLDPHDGDGLHAAMRALLDHPRLQDPEPASMGAVRAAETGKDLSHRGPPKLDTVHWPQDNGPGNSRVSYILPDARLRLRASGVFWPAPEEPDAWLMGNPDAPPTRHRLVWVDIDLTGLN